MRKLIFTIIYWFITTISINAQKVQETIRIDNHTANIYIKPTGGNITADAGSPGRFHFTISMPIVDGSVPPPPAIASLRPSLAGLKIQAFDPYILEERYCYTYTATGSIANALLWEDKTEYLAFSICFGEGRLTTGQYPRIEEEQTNVLIDGLEESIFVAELNGESIRDIFQVFYFDNPDQYGSDVDEDIYVTAEKPLSGTSECSAVMPITLKSFTTERYGDTRASLLKWASASEVNGSHFEIERSIDAQTWAKIGTVNAVGNTTTEVTYEFLDRTIDYARGQDVFYYRLNKVDLDGSSEYTDIRTVRFDPLAEVSVNIYPTLTTGLVRVELASPAGTAPVADANLYDKAGRVINKQEVSTNGITELDLVKYGNGQYFIKMEVNKKVYTTQVIKVN
jgi:hypothetical protein